MFTLSTLLFNTSFIYIDRFPLFMTESSNPNASLCVGGRIGIESYLNLWPFAKDIDTSYSLTKSPSSEFNCYIERSSTFGFQVVGATVTDTLVPNVNKRIRFVEFADFSHGGNLTGVYVRPVQSQFSFSGHSELIMRDIYSQYVIPRNKMNSDQLERAWNLARRIDSHVKSLLNSQK